MNSIACLSIRCRVAASFHLCKCARCDIVNVSIFSSCLLAPVAVPYSCIYGHVRVAVVVNDSFILLRLYIYILIIDDSVLMLTINCYARRQYVVDDVAFNAYQNEASYAH